jgi:uncharacterized protein YdhG (YjbR/CyaY superfamily)
VAKTNYANVNEYIAAQPEAVQPILERVRGIIRRTVPGVEETISYQLPTFRLHATYVVYLSAARQHFALHPYTDGLRDALGDELAPHLSGKGTMRFALSERVPARLIERIARARAKEVAERLKATAQPRKTR